MRGELEGLQENGLGPTSFVVATGSRRHAGRCLLVYVDVAPAVIRARVGFSLPAHPRIAGAQCNRNGSIRRPPRRAVIAILTAAYTLWRAPRRGSTNAANRATHIAEHESCAEVVVYATLD